MSMFKKMNSLVIIIAFLFLVVNPYPVKVYAATCSSITTSEGVASCVDEARSGYDTTTLTLDQQNSYSGWSEFSVSSDEMVNFFRDNGGSFNHLAEVLGLSASEIHGVINASGGNLFIVNGNGIIFGSGAEVNVGGLVATSLGISKEDFYAENYDFSLMEGFDPSFVINQGNIKVQDNGFVVLMSPLVVNEGLILAKSGDVVIAGTSHGVLDFDGNGLVNFTIGDRELNPGTITLEAEYVSDVLKDVVNSSLVEAGLVVENANGTISLVASEGLAFDNGEVNVNGEEGVDAGTIVLHATQTAVTGPDSELLAKGVGENSDGGYIETSTKGKFKFLGEVDAASERGLAGTWLIDPYDIEIVDTLTSTELTEDTTTSGLSLFESGTSENQIADDKIEDRLEAGTNVTIQTMDGGSEEGNITISALIDVTLSTVVTLILNAANDIIVNSGITVTGTEGLNVELNANASAGGTQSGAGVVDINADISTNGGDFSVTGMGFDNTDGTISTGGGEVDINVGGTGEIRLGEKIDAGVGSATLLSGGNITDVGDTDDNNDANDVDIEAGSVSLTGVSGVGDSGDGIEITAIDLTVSTTDSDVYVKETNDLLIKSVSAGTGDVSLEVGGAITDDDTNVDITAGSLSLITGGAIGTSGDYLDTSVTDLTVTTIDDDVYIKEANGLLVKSISVGTGDVSLEVGGAITDDDTNVDITAGSLSLITGGAIGTSGDYLDTSVTDLTVTTIDDDVYIKEANGLLVKSISVGTGDVSLEVGGAITDDDTSVDIVANILNITGATGIGSIGDVLEITVTELTASTTDSDVYVKETNDLLIKSVSAGTGDVSLEVGGAITDDDTSVDITAGSLSLIAGGDIGTSGDYLDTSVTDLTVITIDDNVYIKEANGLLVKSISVGTGDVSLEVGGAITDDDTSVDIVANILNITGATGIGSIGDVLEITVTELIASTTDSDVYVKETNDLLIKSVSAGTGDVSLEVGGSITDDDTSVDVTAGSLSLIAGGDIGTSGDYLDTSVTDLTVTTIDDNVYIKEVNGLLVKSISVGGGNVSLEVGGAITDDDTSVDIVANILNITGATGIGSIGDVLEITVTELIASTTDSDVYVKETNDLLIKSVSAGTGDVSLEVGGAITDDDTSVDVTAGSLSLITGGAIGTSGDYLDTSVTDLTVTTSNDNVYISEANGLLVKSISVGTGDVRLEVGGAITDDDTSVDIVADSLNITGVTGIGSSSDELEITVTELTASTTNSDIFIQETNDVDIHLVNAGTGNIVFGAGGLIDDNSGNGDVDFIATSLDIVGGNGVGTSGNGLEIMVTELTARITTGFINLRQTGDLLIKEIDAGLNTIRLNITGRITDDDEEVDVISGGLILTGTDGIGVVGDELEITVTELTASTTNSDIFIQETNDVDIHLVNAGTGNIVFGAGGLIDDNSGNGDVDFIATSLDIVGGNGVGTSGNGLEMMVTELTARITTGFINLWQPTGDLLIKEISAGLNGVRVDVRTGRITDDDTSVDITAGSLNLIAGGDIGTSVDNLDISVTDLTVTTSDDNVYIKETNDLLVKSVSVGTGDVSLEVGGLITDDDTSVDITAESLSLITGGAIGTSGDYLDTSVTDLTVTTSDDNVYIKEANDLLVKSISVGGGDVSLEVGGVITDDDTSVDIVADSLNIIGAGGIGSNSDELEVTVIELTASTTNSDVYISETNDLLIKSVSVGTGDVILNVGGSVTDDDTSVDITAESLSLITGGAIGTSGDYLDTSVTDLTVTTSDDNVYIKEANDLLVKSISVGGGDVSLEVGGVITDDDTSVDIVADSLNIIGAGGIGSNSDELEVTVIELTASTTNSDVYISETNDLLIKSVSVGTGDVILNVGGSVTDDDTSVDITAESLSLITGGAIGTSGDYLDTSVTDLTVTTSDDNVYIKEANDLLVKSISVGGGDVSLEVGGVITDDDTSVDIVADSLNIIGAGGIGSNSDELEVTVIELTASTTNSDVYISETNDLLIKSVSVGTGDVILNVGGSVTDDDTSVDITAESLSLITGGAIGTSGDYLDTSVTDLTVTTSDDNVYISEASGLLVKSISVGTGDVSLEVGGAITDDDTNVDIIAKNLSITVNNGGVGIDTNVDIIVEITAEGDVNIEEEDEVAFKNIVSTGKIELLAGGDITLEGIKASGNYVEGADGGSVSIRTTSGNVVFKGLVESEKSFVNIRTDVGSIMTENQGLDLRAKQGVSSLEVPEGFISPEELDSENVVEVDIRGGTLFIDITNEGLGRILKDIIGANVRGTIIDENGMKGIPFPGPLPSGFNFPSPLIPPLYIIYNDEVIWPPLNNESYQSLLARVENLDFNIDVSNGDSNRITRSDRVTSQFYLYHPLQRSAVSQESLNELNLSSNTNIENSGLEKYFEDEKKK